MTAFNKGDRVRYVYGPGRGTMQNKGGREGIVMGVSPGWVEVRFDGELHSESYYPKKLDLVERAVPATVTEIKSPGGTLAIVDEAVNHPAHYGGDSPYEVIKVAEAWGFDDDAYLFNVLKYIARAGKKGSKLEDLKKARFYLDRKITRVEDAA